MTFRENATQIDAMVRLGFVTPVLAFVLMGASHAARACEVLAFHILFPSGMGSHTAYYCKATEDEKKGAIDLARRHACIPDKLKESKKTIISSTAVDIKPYWLTKAEAEKSGPVLLVKLLVVEEKTPEGKTMHLGGYQTVATGQKYFMRVHAGQPSASGSERFVGLRFDLGDVATFDLTCPFSECQERITPMCTPQTGPS